MLTLGSMDRERLDRLGALTAHVVEHALGSGLTWDEAILAFGIAARAIAARAERQLKSGMNQSADVLRAWLR